MVVMKTPNIILYFKLSILSLTLYADKNKN